MTSSKNMLSKSFFERNFMFAINVSCFARILFLALKTLLSLSQTCGHTLSYHGICHRNFHSVTKRKFLRLNQCLRKNCADHPYKSEGKSSAHYSERYENVQKVEREQAFANSKLFKHNIPRQSAYQLAKKNWASLNSIPQGAFFRKTVYYRANSKMAISPGPQPTSGFSMQYESIPKWVKKPPSPKSLNEPRIA